MTVLDTKYKQPREELDYDIDYADWLTPGDGITQKNTVVEISPPGLVSPLHTVSGTVVKVWVKGGVSGKTYTVSVLVTTDDGRTKEDEFKVKVKET